MVQVHRRFSVFRFSATHDELIQSKYIYDIFVQFLQTEVSHQSLRSSVHWRATVFVAFIQHVCQGSASFQQTGHMTLSRPQRTAETLQSVPRSGPWSRFSESSGGESEVTRTAGSFWFQRHWWAEFKGLVDFFCWIRGFSERAFTLVALFTGC